MCWDRVGGGLLLCMNSIYHVASRCRAQTESKWQWDRKMLTSQKSASAALSSVVWLIKQTCEKKISISAHGQKCSVLCYQGYSALWIPTSLFGFTLKYSNMLSNFFFHFCFIFTNAQTFLPQIIFGWITSKMAVYSHFLKKKKKKRQTQKTPKFMRYFGWMLLFFFFPTWTCSESSGVFTFFPPLKLKHQHL